MQVEEQHVSKDGFRLRGVALSRIDGFSDVVFGFALTLLVVSTEVPHTYDEFHTVLLGFIPFAICFLSFFSIWHAHYRFFRHYGLHDEGTIRINCLLLFTVLFYVYPLKFLFALMAFVPDARNSGHVFTGDWQLRELVVVYAAGFAAIYLLFAALYANAWRQRRALDLNAVEETLTTMTAWTFAGVGCVGLVVCLIAALLPPVQSPNACFGFLLAAVWARFMGWLRKRRLGKARARMEAAPAAPEEPGEP
jgi:hypothetical protein